MSAFGTKRTSQSRSAMSAFGVKQTSRFQSACLLLTQSGRRSPAFLESPQARDSFVLDCGLFDGALVGVDCECELTREPEADFRLGELLPTQGCTITFYHCIPERSCQRPHAHAQVPSHRRPSVERFRIHVEGMVGSPGWLDGFPEVGRRRGPWRGRWAKDLLDASATGKNNSLRHGAACQRLCKNCNRAATQPSL